MPPTTHQVAVPGGQLHVVVEGNGPPILLVHAGIADLRSWDDLVPLLVNAGYLVARYDTRGFGRSTTDDIEYSNRADLLAVLDGLGIQRAALVGNSRGAMICLDTILESPERAVAFIWVGGGIGGFEGEATPEELALFEAMEAAEEAHDSERVADLDVQIWVDGVGQPADRAPAAIRELVRTMDLPLYDANRIMGQPIPLSPAANERLGEVGLPVLAIVGGLDTTSTQAAAVRLEQGVRDARRVVVPDVAHMVGMEAPAGLADLILEAIRPLGSWA